MRGGLGGLLVQNEGSSSFLCSQHNEARTLGESKGQEGGAGGFGGEAETEVLGDGGLVLTCLGGLTGQRCGGWRGEAAGLRGPLQGGG